jgi:hypothetical protein
MNAFGGLGLSCVQPASSGKTVYRLVESTCWSMEFDRPCVLDSGVVPPLKNRMSRLGRARRGRVSRPKVEVFGTSNPERQMSTPNFGSHLLRTCPVSCVMDQSVDGMVRKSTGLLFFLC